MSDLSDRILLQWFQYWGQSPEDRIAIFNEALEYAGIKATLVINDKKMGEFVGSEEKELDRAENFHNELKKCFPLGEFHKESGAIEGVLKKYKEMVPTGSP